MVLKIVLCFLLFTIYSSEGASMTDISRLRADLLNGYDPHSRPVQNHRNVTVVRINFMLKGFELNERTSVLDVFAWTVLIWEDEHMQWDPRQYGNLTRIHFAAKELWQPDLTVYNNLDKSEIDHFGNTRVVVFNTSHVVWVPPTKFQVGCQTDLRKWPYDTQTCSIVLGSWAHDGSMIDIDIPPNITSMDTSDFKSNREWNLLGTSFQKRVRYFSGVPGVPFPDILLTISMARKSPSHTACVVVPGVVIAMAILIAFWLPPGSHERLSILLVAILVNVLYLYNIYSAIPNNGDNVPLVLLYYKDSLVMLAFALIWTICLRYLAQTQRLSPVPLPSAVQGLLDSVIGKILCLDPRPATGRKAASEETTTGEGMQEEESGAAGNGNPFGSGVRKNNPFQEDWAWLAHLLDRVAFVVYIIVYLGLYGLYL